MALINLKAIGYPILFIILLTLFKKIFHGKNPVKENFIYEELYCKV
jgi:hypothetical protein